MISNKKTARIVGCLFIIGTVAGILSLVFAGSILSDPNYLVKTSTDNRILIGVLLVLIMGFVLTMVPVLMFPIFRKYNEALALGAVIFRGALEGFERFAASNLSKMIVGFSMFVLPAIAIKIHGSSGRVLYFG